MPEMLASFYNLITSTHVKTAKAHILLPIHVSSFFNVQTMKLQQTIFVILVKNHVYVMH